VRSVLVTNHKGGVGKTFVTVHLAKLLAEMGNRVLVVDCDGQADAFRFFARQLPDCIGSFKQASLRLGVMTNEKCKSLKSLNIEEEQYDYIILDSDARLADAVKNILNNKIQVVVAPVNFQSLSIENLEGVFRVTGVIREVSGPYDDKSVDACGSADEEDDKQLRMIRRVAKAIVDHVIIVPLAADNAALNEKLKKYRIKSKVKIVKNMPWLQKETDQSLMSGIAVWELSEVSQGVRDQTKAFFEDLAIKLEKHFDQSEEAK
jgi:MinD-like ATPase involved in chromosome partitioning or flagellar assembly